MNSLRAQRAETLTLSASITATPTKLVRCPCPLSDYFQLMPASLRFFRGPCHLQGPYTKFNSQFHTIKKMYALRRHILRSAYTAGWIWGLTLEEDLIAPSPVDWGQKLDEDGKYVPDWCVEPEITLHDIIFTCSCKGSCSRCKCAKKKFSCLPFCSCNCIAIMTSQKFTIDNVSVHSYIIVLFSCILQWPQE